MMKKISRAILGVVVTGLMACDAAAPPDATVDEASAAAGSVADVARAEEVVDPLPSEPEANDPPVVESEATVAARRALYDVLGEQDVYTRTQKLAALLPTLGPEAAPLMTEIVKDPMLALEASDHALLMRFWATHEPPRACQWALTEAPPLTRIAAIIVGFTVWAEADPLAAKSASEKRISQIGEARDAVQAALVTGWFKANPEQLTQYIHQLGMGLSRQRAVSVYIVQLIRAQGADAAMKWAESLPGGVTFKTAVYRQVASTLPLFDHGASVRWCQAHCDGPYGANMRNILARRWVMQDGNAAMTWLRDYAPEGHETNVAVRAAYSVWSRSDRRAAVAWMTDQSDEAKLAWLRPAIPVYARILAEDSPAEASAWAGQIEDEEEREIVLIYVARIWRQADEAAAEAWLLESSLSEAAREKVRAPARQMGLPQG